MTSRFFNPALYVNKIDGYYLVLRQNRFTSTHVWIFQKSHGELELDEKLQFLALLKHSENALGSENEESTC